MLNQDTILVLDRGRDVCKSISEAVAFRGFSVAEFTSSANAIDFATKHHPIAVFADLTLASEGQGNFLQRLCAIHPRLPVVVMMNPDDSAALFPILHLGVNERLVKPFVSASVCESLDRVLHEDGSGLQTAMAAISERLRHARRRMGLKQSDVARRTGLSVVQISQIESHISSPSMASLLKICRALRTPISEIVSGF